MDKSSIILIYFQVLLINTLLVIKVPTDERKKRFQQLFIVREEKSFNCFQSLKFVKFSIHELENILNCFEYIRQCRLAFI